ncbi:uncharacterized protein F4812DRAFT_466789 [Daldinia caldariorum]|uniref:uncharacterized protein n=1 Tax=Daldinia caldariorum TaxID=326644 RepID=UPI002008C49C|nr:uncharacterized protein F4812DRAFT_466789 [Daldinia caldariorum]KAI1464903.1 hypothetical protein F4812DRAFT_466789 [Daldinia caldariorum]
MIYARGELRDSEEEPIVRSIQQDDFRACDFAKKGILSQWIPQVQDDESNSKRIYFSRRGRAILMQILLITIIFATNLGITLYTISRYDSQNGVGTIYEGDCGEVKSMDQWCHLLINCLSTGMLSASNYCMQLQAAPTRADVDRAHHAKSHKQDRTHQEGIWLDIGVPSLRNLQYISKWRRLAWYILAFTSIPIHLMYNSAVFQSLASNDYTVAVVKNSFANGSRWDLTTAEINRAGDFGWEEKRVNPNNRNYTEIIHTMQRDMSSDKWERMNISSCYALYNDYFAAQGNAVIFVKNDTGPDDDSLLMYVSIVPRSDNWAKNMWAAGNGTKSFVAKEPEFPVTRWFLGPRRYEVSYCRVQSPSTIANKCHFQYSPPIMYTICGFNFIKILVMLCIWAIRKWQQKKRDDAEGMVLYTLGDAIASFIRNPDPTTVDMCLATKDDFIRRRPWKNRLVKQPLTLNREAREWKKRRKFWFSAARKRQWFTLLFSCCLVILIAGILLGNSFKSLRRRKIPTTISGLWQLGFGTLTPYTYLCIGLPLEDPAGLISNVLLANLPQLVVSFLYIFCNTMLSTFLVQHEFSRMYRKRRKPLRVSEPVGIQRSSYFISLPLRYGIPLYTTSSIIHWLVSQSLFLARITAICADGSQETCPAGQIDFKYSFSTCGHSPFAVLITLIVGGLIVIVIAALGFRTYDGTMNMVSTNSMAISAACHVLEEDREEAYLLPVQWGVVEIKDGVGKCAFTTAPDDRIKMPEVGLKYK